MSPARPQLDLIRRYLRESEGDGREPRTRRFRRARPRIGVVRDARQTVEDATRPPERPAPSP